MSNLPDEFDLIGGSLIRGHINELNTIQFLPYINGITVSSPWLSFNVRSGLCITSREIPYGEFFAFLRRDLEDDVAEDETMKSELLTLENELNLTLCAIKKLRGSLGWDIPK